MRAARYYGKEDIRVEEIEEPVCKPGQIKIKPAFVGICGTDLHEYLGGPNFAPVKPHAVTKETLPVTFGHEFSGTVIEVGEGVTGFEIGQKASIQPTIYDGTCPACHRGLENICYNGGFVGLSGWGGGLSDAVTVPANYVLPLPDNVPLDIGALVEPLSVGWHAVSQSPLKKDSNVLILGGGPIGISVILALRARGCGYIIVSELSSSRQRFARHFGASHIIDPTKETDFVKQIRSLAGGEGVDIVFDCAGVAVGLEAACQSIKARGTVVNVAIWEKAIPFQPNDLVFKEGKYVACLGYVQQDFIDVIKAISSGAMKPGDMITRKIALENVVEDGIKTLISDKDNHVKILVEI
ncbi:putative diacetyl reductase [Hyphodiscus hymeniophilus]|uniref:Diacetyl reductase n=1 Tax=Hyphodiscus hymeniophilus TaxID=353542 RepID=A0A9P6VGT3_9HELO|nr:putative diacetyl reductase [Hyphodiscus hymeniophilus]